MPAEWTDEQRVQFWKENLPSMEGKRVKVRMRRRKDLDATPGEANEGYYFEDHYGIVLSPAIRTHPPDKPQGMLVLYIQTWDQLKQTLALALVSIEEVDDEFEATDSKEVAMSALQP
jgi:hypothetical protein